MASKNHSVKSASLQENGKIKIIFPFDWSTMATIKKEMEGRKFISKGKYWTADLTLKNVLTLVELNFRLDDTLQAKLNRVKRKKEGIKEDRPIPLVSLPPLRKEPYPYQHVGISWLEMVNGRGLIGDEMGLGKTLQSIGWLALHPEKKPVIIVTPASLKYNWEKELKETLIQVPTIEVLSGMVVHNTTAEILIINYDILGAWVDELRKRNPQVIITDECHYYKNKKAKRTKAVIKLCQHIPHVLALSGTPIKNRPIEFYVVLKLLDHTVIPDYWSYAQRYCGARYSGYGWDFSGATNTDELYTRINKIIMLRRKKKDVLKDLPDKVYSYVPIELENRKTYQLAERDWIAFLKQDITQNLVSKLADAGVVDAGTFINHEQIEKEARRQNQTFNQLVELEKLKQIAVKGKLNGAIKWIDEFLEVMDEKLVVFTTHKFVIEKLMAHFEKKAVKVDGSVSQKQRHVNVQKFQEEKGVRLFFGQMQAAGVGLTLTAASNVVILEFPNSPGDLDQAVDRVHRISQLKKVTAWLLLAKDTVEDRMVQLIDSKRKVLDGVLDGRETEKNDLISELIKGYLNEDV